MASTRKASRGTKKKSSSRKSSAKRAAATVEVAALTGPPPSNTGLRPFAMHRDEAASAPAMASLAAAATADFSIVPELNLSGVDKETAARQHLSRAFASEALPSFTAGDVSGEPGEYKSIGTETVPLTGTTTVKFRQHFHKVPVYGSIVTVELDDQNALVALNSSLAEPVNIDPVARVSPADALDTVRKAAGYQQNRLTAIPRLNFYYDREVSRWRLVYITENVEKKSEVNYSIPQLYDYVTDAHSGELVDELPRTQSLVKKAADELKALREIECAANGTGFVLRDTTRNVATFDFSFRNINAEFRRLPGAVVSNQPPKPWSPAAISAHANATEVVDFLAKVLRRKGLDNAGGPVISTINCVDRPGTQEWKNAAWVGTQMVYGQRKVGTRLRSYAAAKDVVAHEIFHGLTDKTSRLEYRGQSGALNESYSDIFGIIVSNINQPNIAKWDWRLGEDLTETGLPIRNLADPTKHRQPAHMNDYLRLPETREGDWGGVHWNSGIHNKAAHTILTTRRGGQFLFTAAQVAAMFYLALTQSLSRTSDFAASRRAVELWARSLFRNDADRDVKVQAVSDAFAGVGIT